MTMGRVKWFSEAKGFGFIEVENQPSGRDVYVHYTAIRGSGFKTLREGARVQFELLDTEQGPEAAHVEVISE